MKISKKTPILGLKKVISRLFEVEFPQFDYEKYHPLLIHSLKEMYEIDAFFAHKDCGYETIRFFCNQDRLVPYQDLALEEKLFTFLKENQSNWFCQTALGSNKVYFYDRVEPHKSQWLPLSIDPFLTTFALQEIAFNLPYYFGMENGNVSDIKAHFKTIEPLWTDKKYIYDAPHAYYLVDGSCLLMYGGMNIFATHNEAIFNHYKSILPHYTF
jgi:hypothetical protein